MILPSLTFRDGNDPSHEMNLLLQCLHALISLMPWDIVGNCHFKRYICTKLSPTLIALLDVADHQDLTRPKSSGFWNKRQECIKLSESSAKTLSQAFVELAILLGPDAEMRPVLESLFHRLLICSQTKYRTMALQSLNEVKTYVLLKALAS